MAIRQEELLVTEAVVYRFPTAPLRSRRARAAMLRRRRTTLGVAAVVAALALLMGFGPGDHVLEGPDRPVVSVKVPR